MTTRKVTYGIAWAASFIVSLCLMLMGVKMTYQIGSSAVVIAIATILWNYGKKGWNLVTIIMIGSGIFYGMFLGWLIK
jgi:predicted membrane protein